MEVTAATAAPATTTTTTKPSRRGPAIKIRRYGRSDFEKFDEETARGSHLCVGSATIGKVDIDCKYHWKKAQWGVLGREETPAGVVYMDITFKQPHGYWLERASVFITLSEDMSSYALSAPRQASTQPTRSLSSEYAVQFTNYYGPRLLTGTKTVSAESKEHTFVPTIGAMGFQLGGIGLKSNSSAERVGRWVFKGTLCRPKGRDGLRTLEWELSENSINPDQVHGQTYQTAFAFEHSKRPVFMRVEVEGKLRDRSRQMKHELLKFSSSFGRKDNSTLTELDLGRNVEFRKPLDHIAQSLDMAMQWENTGNLPVEVPDPAGAQFMHDEARPESLLPPPQRPPLQPHPASEPWTGVGAQELRGTLRLQGRERRYIEDSPDPILQSLQRQLRDRVGSDLAAHIHVRESRSGSETTEDEDATLVNNSAPPSVKPTPPPDAVAQAIQELAQFPALLLLVRYLAALIQWFTGPPRALPAPTGKPISGPPQGDGPVDEPSPVEGRTPRRTGRLPDRRRSDAIETLPSPLSATVESRPVGRRGVSDPFK